MNEVIRTGVKSFSRDEKGATMFEYAILVGVIALIAIGGATVFGKDLQKMYENLAASITGVNTSATTS